MVICTNNDCYIGIKVENYLLGERPIPCNLDERKSHERSVPNFALLAEPSSTEIIWNPRHSNIVAGALSFIASLVPISEQAQTKRGGLLQTLFQLQGLPLFS